MAHSTITFQNPHDGKLKEAPAGFSWTMLFFGFFPPLFRGDWKYAVITLAIALVTSYIGVIILCFMYNRLYIKDCIRDGYRAKYIRGRYNSLDDAEYKIGFKLPRLES